jgi:Icc-related predicted phosphoesterase
LARTKIFFVTDVHGSDRCFRKFINAGKFYGANVLILGGDITGKMIVPIVKQPDGTFECEYGGVNYTKSSGELENVIQNIKDSGYYPYITNRNEVEELSAKPDLVTNLFKALMRQRIEEWTKLAGERLNGSGITCYISPGNDDFFEIDEVLDRAGFVVNPEGKVVDIDGEHEMITLGFANHTPWNSPREVDEEILRKKIDGMANKVKDMNTTIFNIHVPPIGTPIDQAPKLDETLKPVISGGSIAMISAGSTAVRESIEKYQPLIGMHGHIHESRGMVKIGRTICFNPGSEYNSGVLRGLLCDLDRDSVKSYLLTSG